MNPTPEQVEERRRRDKVFARGGGEERDESGVVGSDGTLYLVS